MEGRRIAAFSGFERTVTRSLDQIDAAVGLRDLSRPGNRLEALKGRRRGQWSTRIGGDKQLRMRFYGPESACCGRPAERGWWRIATGRDELVRILSITSWPITRGT